MEQITIDDLQNLPDQELKDLLDVLETIDKSLEEIEEGDSNE